MEILVTSSLHGLIVAEAYGIPVVLLRNQKHKAIEHHFKYIDYFASTGRDNLTCFDESLDMVVRKPLPPPKMPPLDRLVEAFPSSVSQNAVSKNDPGEGAIDNLAEFLINRSQGKTFKIFFAPGDAGNTLGDTGMLHYLLSNKVPFEIITVVP